MGLGVPGVVVIAVQWGLGGLFVLQDQLGSTTFRISPGQPAGTTAAVVGLVVLALTRRRTPPIGPGAPPAPWVVALVTALLLVVRSMVPTGWVGTLLAAAAILAWLVLAGRWSRREGWTGTHVVAAVTGDLLSIGLPAFLTTPLGARTRSPSWPPTWRCSPSCSPWPRGAIGVRHSGWVTIHRDHPFADPVDDPVRRFRGRLGGTVSLWTAGEGSERAGLTVSSYLVGRGEPAHVLGLLDPDADLTLVALRTGSLVVQLLEWRHRDLAEEFAGRHPAPGGLFRNDQWRQTEWGPLLTSASAWVGLRLLPEPREVGWSVLVDSVVEHVELGESTAPLVHRRGRYQRPAAPPAGSA